MTPAFVPLSLDRLETALRLREKLYLHEDLSYEEGNAAALMQELIGHPEFGEFWLIEAEGEAAGYLLFTLCYSLEFGGRFGLLDEFFVEERWRGQGFGATALAFLEHAARGLGLRAIRLEVSHGNPGAQKLYQRHGYTVDPRHLMTKWL